MKRTLSCKSCFSIHRVERLLPYVRQQTFSHCPSCGSSRVIVKEDSKMNYWDTMAESVGLPTYIVRELFNLWDTKEYESFADFIREAKRSAQAGTTQLSESGDRISKVS